MKAQIPEHQKLLLLQFYLSPDRPQIGQSVARFLAYSKWRGEPKLFSHSTYRRFLQKYEAEHKAECIFVRDGILALRNRTSPFIRRDKISEKIWRSLHSTNLIINAMTEIQPATICRTGIRYKGNYYYNSALAERVGNPILIHSDKSTKPTTIKCFSICGEFICEASLTKPILLSELTRAAR